MEPILLKKCAAISVVDAYSLVRTLRFKAFRTKRCLNVLGLIMKYGFLGKLSCSIIIAEKSYFRLLYETKFRKEASEIGSLFGNLG